MSPCTSTFKARKDDCIIAVCGATGAGKSTLIEQLTRQPGYVGHGLNSHTSIIRPTRLVRQGKPPMVLVDTPGFDNTDCEMTDIQVLRMLADWLTQNYYQNKSVDGVLFLHRISDNRFSCRFRDNLARFVGLCGQEALRKVSIVTTMWDMIKPDTAQGRQEELIRSLSSDPVQRPAQVAMFSPASETQAWAIIDGLLDQSQLSARTVAPDIQEELQDALEQFEAQLQRRSLRNKIRSLKASTSSTEAPALLAGLFSSRI